MTENRDTWLKRGLTALEILLIAGIVFAIVRAVLLLTNPKSGWAPVGATAIPAGPARIADQKAFNLDFDPFHRTQVISVETRPAEGEDAPETNLDLKLVGRRTGDNATAVLQTPDGGQRNYKVGDEIMNGVTLKSVHPDYIVLSQNGRLERLTFNEGSETGLRISAERSAALAGLDLQTLMSSISFTPVINGERVEGQKIKSRNPELPLSRFGLEPGDVVTHVNGVDFRQQQVSPSQLLQAFTGNSRPKIRLIRNGQPQTIEIKL